MLAFVCCFDLMYISPIYALNNALVLNEYGSCNIQLNKKGLSSEERKVGDFFFFLNIIS